MTLKWPIIWSQKWPKNDSKMMQKWPKNSPNIAQKWLKMTQNDSKLPKMEPNFESRTRLEINGWEFNRPVESWYQLKPNWQINKRTDQQNQEKKTDLQKYSLKKKKKKKKKKKTDEGNQFKFNQVRERKREREREKIVQNTNNPKQIW